MRSSACLLITCPHAACAAIWRSLSLACTLCAGEPAWMTRGSLDPCSSTSAASRTSYYSCSRQRETETHATTILCVRKGGEVCTRTTRLHAACMPVTCSTRTQFLCFQPTGPTYTAAGHAMTMQHAAPQRKSLWLLCHVLLGRWSSWVTDKPPKTIL